MMRWGRGGALRHSRLQMILAVAAIGTAVALPVVLVSVGGGVSAHELANLQNAGYQIVVSAAGAHGIANAHRYADRILGISGVTAASPVLSVTIDAFSSSRAVAPVLAEGVIPGQFGPTLGPPEAGLFPLPLPLGDPTDSIHYDNGTYSGAATYDVMVSSPYAQQFHVTAGNHIVLSPAANESMGISYNVTGVFGVPPSILGPTGAFAVLLPLSDLQTLTGFAGGKAVVPDAADTIQIAVSGPVATNPSALSQLRAQIQQLFQYYGVSSLTQEAQQLEAASGVLTGFYLALSSVGVTIGLLFLALVLLRRVEADRRSIGIRRALGVSNRTIAGEILGDGAVLALTGAVAGLVAGYLIVEGMARWATEAVQQAAQLAVFDPVLLGELVAAIVGLSLVAGLVATRSALRTEITEALR
ncbi:MAG TPA: FtsX-like permease family protein [Thermoplasmata archaeon]|nr:FtsX-like permease family protein [Thermoplasmata archaeon]